MMDMVVPGRRKRGRPKRRWMDLAGEDIERVGAREGDEVDQVKWRILLHCGNPNREKPKEEKQLIHSTSINLGTYLRIFKIGQIMPIHMGDAKD